MYARLRRARAHDAIEFGAPPPGGRAAAREATATGRDAANHASLIAAATTVYGEIPIVNGVSAEGTILRHVWIPCVLTGFANPGANLHAPDENIHVDKYLQGIKYAAAIMEHFGRS